LLFTAGGRSATAVRRMGGGSELRGSKNRINMRHIYLKRQRLFQGILLLQIAPCDLLSDIDHVLQHLALQSINRSIQ